MKMMFFLLFSLLLLQSCSGDKQTLAPESSQSKDSIVRIDNIDTKVFQYEASNELKTITIGPIYDSSNKIVKSSDIFILESQEPTLSIGQLNVTQENSLLQSIEVNPSTDGKISFKVKLPTDKGLKKISIKAKTYESVTGLIYVQVDPSVISKMGSVKTANFVDTSPYDGIKQSNEKQAIVAKSDNTVVIGPITDQYNNKIASGQIDIILKNGFFGQNIKDVNGQMTSKYTFTIQDGFVSAPIKPIDPAILVDIVGVKKDAVSSIDDLSNLLSTNPQMVAMDSVGVLSSNITITDIENLKNYGIVFIGTEKIKTLTITNSGNSKISNFIYAIDAPFSIESGSCVGKEYLLPNENCTLAIKFKSENRSFVFSSFRINGKINGEPIPEIYHRFEVQAAYPANLEVQLENSLLEFEPHAVGELVIKSFIIMNTGDVPATNVSFINPLPYLGQNEGFYKIKSLSDSVPNDDPDGGEHCGLTLDPQRKCKIYVEFYPTAKTDDQLLSATIAADGVQVKTIFVKGKSYVNNFERDIGINAVKYKIQKDESDNVDVIVGPVRDLYGAAVPNQIVQIQVYRLNSDQLKVPLGQISSNSLVVGGPVNTYLLQTDSLGYATFNLKSKQVDEVGDFSIQARIVDNEQNELASGIRGFAFSGVKLAFDKEILNFARTIINKESSMSVKLSNNGTMIANNVGLGLINSAFSIVNEGDCSGILSGSLTLDIETSCTFYVSFKPLQRITYFQELTISSSSVGNKVSSDLYGVGVNPIRLVSDYPKIYDTFVIGSTEPLKGKITFSNVGDEIAENLTAFAEKENSAFSFAFTCTEMSENGSCTLNYEYLPTVIPDQILTTNIVIQGQGAISELLNSVQIPIEFNHSSMKFLNQESGINLRKCFPLQIKGFDIDNSDLDYSKDVPLSLSTTGTGIFYSNSQCTTSISSIVIPANQYLTPVFYYRPTVAGLHVLRANSERISSAVKSFVVYKDPVGYQLISPNFQKTYIDKALKEKIIMRVVDEDGEGVPNIPVNFNLLEDPAAKTNYISNGSFSSSISGWTVNASASWFSGYNGSLRLASKTEIAQAKSGIISVSPGQSYYYIVKVGESVGTPATANIIINILNANDSSIIQTNELEGVRTGVYKINIPGNLDSIKLEVKTKGFSINTSVFIDSITLIDNLNIGTQEPIQFGTVSPMITSIDEGPGNIIVDFLPGKSPIISVISATSSYDSIPVDKMLLIANSVEFQSNITGALGEFVLSSTGPTLIKNGSNNLAELQGIAGYSWSASTKKLTLPANRVYDFKNFNINPGTTLEFSAPASKEPAWTAMYAKESCVIDGKITAKGFSTNGTTKNLDYISVDSDILSAILEAYPAGRQGGNGGPEGIQSRQRTRSCYQTNFCISIKGEYCPPPAYGCDGWSSDYIVSNSPQGSANSLVNTSFNGGAGANGTRHRYTSSSYSLSNGGSGGSKGTDGGLLFLNCYAAISGNGIVDVSGNQGGNGAHGGNGSYVESSASCNQRIENVLNGNFSFEDRSNGTGFVYYCSIHRYNRTPTYPETCPSNLNAPDIYNLRCWGGNQGGTDCSYERRFPCSGEIYNLYSSGGGGAGSGGNGGNGGQIVVKTKADVSSLTLNVASGTGGIAGSPGVTPYGYNGTAGVSGVNGSNGKCYRIDGNSLVMSSCDGAVSAYSRSCNELLIKDPTLRNQNGHYTIDIDGLGSNQPFQVYCDMTTDNGGWTLISASGTTCGSNNVSRSPGFLFGQDAGTYTSSCGFYDESLVSKMAQFSGSVRLRAGSSVSSYSQAISSGINTLAALRNKTNWHNGAAAEFNNWSWNVACATTATFWPNMFQSCGNGGGTHWINATSAGAYYHSNVPAGSPYSSTWLK